jgi:hypothetical protein
MTWREPVTHFEFARRLGARHSLLASSPLPPSPPPVLAAAVLAVTNRPAR